MRFGLLRFFLGLVIIGVLAAGSRVLPVQKPTMDPVSVSGQRTMLCPTLDPALVDMTISATALEPIKGRTIGTEAVAPVTGPIRSAATPVVLTSDQSLGALSFGATSAGPLPGLWLASCDPPEVDQAFVGLISDPTRRAFLVLTNPDQTQAVVDVSLYSASGRLQAPGTRSVVVLGNSTQTLALEPLVQDGAPISALVRASSGRISAVARIEGGGGADWVQPAQVPQQNVVIPGVPGGEGERTLAIVNPGERRATVSVDLVTASGTFTGAGVDQIDVPPQTTITVNLAEAMQTQGATLVLRSTEPVTAAAWSRTADGGDVAVSVARPAFAGRTVLPVLANMNLTASNVGSEPASVTLAGTAGANLTTTEIPAGVTVQLPVASTDVVDITSPSSSVYLGLSVTQIGDTGGLGVAALGPGGGGASSVSPVIDPRLAD